MSTLELFTQYRSSFLGLFLSLCSYRVCCPRSRSGPSWAKWSFPVTFQNELGKRSSLSGAGIPKKWSWVRQQDGTSGGEEAGPQVERTLSLFQSQALAVWQAQLWRYSSTVWLFHFSFKTRHNSLLNNPPLCLGRFELGFCLLQLRVLMKDSAHNRGSLNGNYE